MNLYDDLDPGSGDRASNLLGSTWVSGAVSLTLSDKSKKRKLSSADSHVDTALKKIETMSGKAACDSASTLRLFKPTALLARPKAPLVTTASTADCAKAYTPQLRRTTVSTTQAPISGIPHSVMDPSISETDQMLEFNSNSIFDVEDPYDPLRPNDYIKLCEEREEKARRDRIVEDNVKQLQQQEQMRAEREQKRKAAIQNMDMTSLLDPDGKSNFESISRGRGRGIVNLPSWLVNQNAKAKESFDDRQVTDQLL